MTDENQQAEELEAQPSDSVTEELENASTETEQQPTDDGQKADEEAGEDDSTAKEDAGAAKKNKVPAGKRIRQLTRNWRNEQRQREALQARLDALEKRIGPPPEPPRPVRDNYETTEEYEDALFDWRDEKNAVQEPPQTEPAPVVDETQAHIIEEFEGELEDLEPEAVELVMETDWPCSTDMTDYIMASDKRAELAYHLAKNNDISAKIAKMSPILAMRELAKVESSLSDTHSGSQTETPPPPANTGTPGGSTGMTDPDKMSTDQWVAMRRKQLANR